MNDPYPETPYRLEIELPPAGVVNLHFHFLAEVSREGVERQSVLHQSILASV